MLHIAGLGPGNIDEISMGVLKLLKSERVILRTEIHPTVDELKKLGLSFRSLDSFYDAGKNFDEIYDNISNEVIKIYKEDKTDLVYCVPGNPVIAEKTVMILIEKLKREEIPYKIHAAVSFIDAVMSRLGIDPIEGLRIADALDMDRSSFDGQAHLLITQVYNKRVASDVKLKLTSFMDEEGEVILLHSVGNEKAETVRKIKLFELDRQKEIDHLTSVFIDKKEFSDGFNDLINTTSELRDRDHGCPWDKEQSHESLKRYLVEEAYEVIDAIDNGDIDDLEEELGDMLFQVMIHSQIAKEDGEFDIFNVIKHINQKMISRHPHVFKDVKVKDSKEVLVNWEQLKSLEKGTETLKDKLSKIPKSSPASIRTREFLKKAKSFGIDKPNYEQIINEIRGIWASEKPLDTRDIVRNIYLSYVLMDLLGEDAESLVNSHLNVVISRILDLN